MQDLQAFKFELRPKGQQIRQMARLAGSCRFVFNKALATQQERYKHGDQKLNYGELCTQKRRGWQMHQFTHCNKR